MSAAAFEDPAAATHSGNLLVLLLKSWEADAAAAAAAAAEAAEPVHAGPITSASSS